MAKRDLPAGRPEWATAAWHNAQRLCTECSVRVNDYGECECTGYPETEAAEAQATTADRAAWEAQDTA